MSVAASSLKIDPAQFKTALEDLKQLVEIPSVSDPNSPDYKAEHLDAAADFVSSRLKVLGFTVWSRRVEGSSPFILAKKIVDSSKPTLLLYAHYDVQPVDRSKWSSDPFVMEERDGRLYGRGSSDDKGGIITILAALGAYLKAGLELPVNVKVLCEGEEEYGSSHMKGLLEEEGGRLEADALVVMDGLNRVFIQVL